MDCHRQYLDLVLALCDKFMIAADPKKNIVRVNFQKGDIETIEITVSETGFFMHLINNAHHVQGINYCRDITSVLKIINLL